MKKSLKEYNTQIQKLDKELEDTAMEYQKVFSALHELQEKAGDSGGA